MEWKTPLERLLRQRSCPFCRLLLHMLSRPQNDPLRVEAVAKHVSGAYKNWTLSELAEEDLPSIYKHWPFGRTAKREKASASWTEDFLNGAEDIIMGPLSYIVIKESAAKGRGAIPDTANGVNFNKDVIGLATTPLEYELQRMTMESHEETRKNRYRKECSLTVTLYTSKSTKHPSGHLAVKCWGYTGHPESKRRLLSNFHLRVADDRISSSHPRGPLSHGQKVDPKWIELRIAGQWLSECMEKHGDRCHTHGWEAARKNPQHLRAVDVQERCIVELNDTSIPYVALSYMWGTGGKQKLLLTRSNMAALQKPYGLTRPPNTIPRTIADAMEVVKAIGLRYLWVDALDKNDPQAELETGQMDRIYGGALLTLVAASGDSAESGIAGVRSNPSMTPGSVGIQRNLQQASAQVHGAHIIASLDNQNNLESTRWNRRGWTFQERLLSRRLLVFAHDEMVWYCRGMTCREDMDHGVEGKTHPLNFLTLNPEWFEGNKEGARKPPAAGFLDGSTKHEDRRWADGCLETDRFGRTHLVRSRRLAEYVNAVEQYTHRELTDKGDIERAFLGLGSIFETSFKTKLIYGLLESVLDVTLLWRPQVPLKRRICSDPLPSWSWVGWEGAVRYATPFHLDRDKDGAIKRYESAALGEEGIRPLLRYYTWDCEKRRWAPANVTGRGFPHPKRAFPEGWQRSFPEGRYRAPGENQPPSRPVIPEGFVDTNWLRPYHLMFSTKSLKAFRLGQAANNVGLYEARPPNSESPRPLEILDDRGRPIGALTLDTSGPPPADLSQYELIVLSEAHGLKKPLKQPHGPKEEYNVVELKDYLVMLVAETGRRNIYERRGLGQVGKRFFEEGNAEIKTIILA
ncbi:hypothetical protein PG985_007821 [Apiospora marii]|uniref:uncharacterized protein n=1 Tax=Apiospora marii TaxID=335849 RepID=UPI0031321808